MMSQKQRENVPFDNVTKLIRLGLLRDTNLCFRTELVLVLERKLKGDGILTETWKAGNPEFGEMESHREEGRHVAPSNTAGAGAGETWASACDLDPQRCDSGCRGVVEPRYDATVLFRAGPMA